MMTADKIKELIATVDGVSLVGEFSIDKAGSLTGRIAVAIGVGNDRLVWDVVISPTYPFKAMGWEPIQFFNKSLLDYPHIMQRGNLCMHPAEFEDAESQFVNDLEQLKEWVDRYYVIGEKDAHYEHLVVNHFLIRDAYYTYCFAETEGDIVDGDFGIVHYAALKNGQKNDSSVSNYIVQQLSLIHI